MSKSDLSKVAWQLHRNRTFAWVLFCTFATYLQDTPSLEQLRSAVSETIKKR